MTSGELLENIIILGADDLLSYIRNNSDNLRLCFLQSNPERGDSSNFSKVISTLAQKQMSDIFINSQEIQALYTHLAYYFKRFNKWQFVDSCTTNIQENIFKRRLSAWLHYKRYNVHQLHVSEFENYIKKLSAAIHDEDDDYTYEILSDLHDYKSTGLLKLAEPLRDKVIEHFSDSELQAKYPILRQFQNDSLQILPDIEVEDLKEIIYYPTEFVEAIFNQNFMDYVKANRLFGYSMEKATEEVIKKGQADFDQGFEQLSASQVVKVYCYCNMRMHFFSSISLYERSELISLFYNTSNKLKFIDIGCGPGTCGLAFVDQILSATGVEAIFEYYGIDSSMTMQNQALEILTNFAFPNTNGKFFHNDIRDIDIDSLTNSSCIIINTCYVFASENLPINCIADFIRSVKIKYPFTPIYLLFQNPKGHYLNKRYEEFKELLPPFVVSYTKTSRIRYCYKRSIGADVKDRVVFFEVLKF